MFALWQTGSFTNRDIGRLYGISPSTVSRRVKSIAARCCSELSLARRLESILNRTPGKTALSTARALEAGQRMNPPRGPRKVL